MARSSVERFRILYRLGWVQRCVARLAALGARGQARWWRRACTIHPRHSHQPLQHTSLRAISRLNLCGIDQVSLDRTIQAYPQAKRIGVMAGDRFAVVVKCGSDTRVIRLPADWEVDMGRLRRERPKIAALWSSEKSIGTRAFGPLSSMDMVPPKMEARFQPADEATLAELRSGKFDAGLAPRSFRDDVAAARSAPGPEFTVKLVNADHFRFERYVEPRYPPLAKQAQISGTVELEMTWNSRTGETEKVTVISGIRFWLRWLSKQHGSGAYSGEVMMHHRPRGSSSNSYSTAG